MATRHSRRQPQSLASGRPAPSAARGIGSRNKSGLAARHTRRTIRQHHVLQKQHASALAASDDALAESLAHKIEEAGGLKAYQQASRTGQSRERGGDASSVLVAWLKEREIGQQGEAALSMLDVGALTCDTAASKSGLFRHIVRIDLESNDKGIQKQDFMERQLPKQDEDKFNLVSLSLVLNYVPDPKGRGAMLRRVGEFLRAPESRGEAINQSHRQSFLFIVLPAPCLTNSRYLTDSRFDAILSSLGFSVINRKTSAKLCYLLCSFDATALRSTQDFEKREVHPGATRNNFAIVLE